MGKFRPGLETHYWRTMMSKYSLISTKCKLVKENELDNVCLSIAGY